MNPHLQRALLLHEQGRHDLAEAEVRLALAIDPDDALAHVILSDCLLQKQEFDAAVEEARKGIAAAPGAPFTHRAMGRVYLRRNYLPEAEAAAREAIELDPTDPDSFSLLGAILTRQEKWGEALRAANEGLQHDAEHLDCANLRSLALMQLGRRHEAGAAAEEALARNPEDSCSHANRGWSLLHDGDPNKALHHFRESLRLEPDNDMARAGLIEALKARWLAYRLLLGFFLWMARLNPQVRWGIVIGFLILQQVAASAVKQNPALKPIIEPFMIAYISFVVLTWVAVPLSNLVLRFNRYGRFALSSVQRAASNWVGLLVALALASIVWTLVEPHETGLGWLMALGFAMVVIPIGGATAVQPGWPRWVMIVWSVGMAVASFTAAGRILYGVSIVEENGREALALVESGADILVTNSWAGVISSFVASWLSSVRPRL